MNVRDRTTSYTVTTTQKQQKQQDNLALKNMSALQERNTNAQAISSPPAKADAAGAEMRDEKVFDQAVEGNGYVLYSWIPRWDKSDQFARTRQAYISPSDSIMSPASQKLSSFKQKQINKQYDFPRRAL